MAKGSCWTNYKTQFFQIFDRSFQASVGQAGATGVAGSSTVYAKECDSVLLLGGFTDRQSTDTLLQLKLGDDMHYKLLGTQGGPGRLAFQVFLECKELPPSDNNHYSYVCRAL